MKAKLKTACAVATLMLALTPTSPAFSPHPRVRAAIDAMVAAKDELLATPGDFDRHKTVALEAMDKAIEQLRIIMTF
jgi:hypothetical protein